MLHGVAKSAALTVGEEEKCGAVLLKMKADPNCTLSTNSLLTAAFGDFKTADYKYLRQAAGHDNNGSDNAYMWSHPGAVCGIPSHRLHQAWLNCSETEQADFIEWIEANEPKWDSKCVFEDGILKAPHCSTQHSMCCIVTYTDRIINLSKRMVHEYVKIQRKSLVKKAVAGKGSVLHWVSLIKRAVFATCGSQANKNFFDGKGSDNKPRQDIAPSKEWLMKVPQPTRVQVLPKEQRLEAWKYKVTGDKWPLSCNCACGTTGAFEAAWLPNDISLNLEELRT